jgi:hypothetical protein
MLTPAEQRRQHQRRRLLLLLLLLLLQWWQHRSWRLLLPAHGSPQLETAEDGCMCPPSYLVLARPVKAAGAIYRTVCRVESSENVEDAQKNGSIYLATGQHTQRTERTTLAHACGATHSNGMLAAQSIVEGTLQEARRMHATKPRLDADGPGVASRLW